MKATALRRWIRDLRHTGSEVAIIFATDDTIFKKTTAGEPAIQVSTGLCKPVRLSGEVTRTFTTGKTSIHVAML